MLEHIRKAFRAGMSDELHRRALLFNILNLALGAVALVMSVVNFFTEETTLMYITLVFAFLCFADFFLVKFGKITQYVANFLFLLGIMILLTHFIITGMPQGFSVLWTLLVPACVLAIFGMRDGCVMCAVVFLDIVFLFWTPWGRSFLQWQYSETFMLRFPFVYISIFCIAVYIEYIQMGTMKRLKESEKSFRYLYQHDALTGLFNRHAFRDEMETTFQNSIDEHMAILLLDIDDFKKINDQFGHNMGDEVLRTIARIINESTCEHCISCRWGGEEFLALMKCRHNPREVAERIRKAVEKTQVTYDGLTISFTVSVGVATAYGVKESEIAKFINLADKAMYVSKTTGKNRTTVRSMESSMHPLDEQSAIAGFE